MVLLTLLARVTDGLPLSASIDNSNEVCFYNKHLTQNKMNLFVLSGHESESFAAVITTHHKSELRFR